MSPSEGKTSKGPEIGVGPACLRNCLVASVEPNEKSGRSER